MLTLLVIRIYEVCRYDILRWHDIRKKIHKDSFRLSRDVKGNT
jgi:hypothetical protein